VVLAALAAYVVAVAAAAWLASGPPARRALAVAVAAAGLAAPWFVPAHLPLERAVIALGGAWGVARVLDLARERLPRPGVLRRLVHVFAVVDTRTLAPRPRTIAWGLLAGTLVAALAAAAALAVSTASAADPDPGPSRLVLRWAAAVAFVLATAEALDRGVRVLFRLAGFEAGALQRAPLRSTTLREFWGRRWNRVVQAWLSEHAFGPVARRHGAGAGTAAAFGASALLHAYLLIAAAGAAAAATWAAFFAVQGALVLAEARLGVARWRPGAGRAWTLGTLLATAPLFVEPLLRCF
jgi:hypothetical protein